MMRTTNGYYRRTGDIEFKNTTMSSFFYVFNVLSMETRPRKSESSLRITRSVSSMKNATIDES